MPKVGTSEPLVRRWEKRERVLARTMVAGLVALCAWPALAVAHLGWTLMQGADQSFTTWAWVFGGLLAFLAVTALAHGFVQRRREEATYAGGAIALGRVDQVITHPQDADGFTTYSLMLTAELAESVRLRRAIHMGHERHAPRKWEGRTVRFRHNTQDPDDMTDILFVGFVESHPG